MVFSRKIEAALYEWKAKQNRKPLLLRLPIEVKSGAKGSLRSLHEYMDIAPHDLAIRVLGNQLSLEKSQTRAGKTFKLLNVPYFAVSQLDKYIEWAMTMESEVRPV